ncbi:MAG: response regulator [Phycisphaerae bacterium]|nr:response regulator [Phycisphaerae bacterium]
MATDKTIKILLVEDNPGDVLLLKVSLKSIASVQFKISLASTLSQALNQLQSNHYDVVLLDLSLPDSSGMETLEQIQQHYPNVAIIVLTGMSSEELAARAVRQGAQDYLVKSQADGPLLIRAINYAIERKEYVKELQKLNRCSKVLSAVNHAMVRATDEQTFLKDISQIIVELGGYRMVWIGMMRGKQDRVHVEPAACAGVNQEAFQTAICQRILQHPSLLPTHRTLRNKGSYTIKDIAHDEEFAWLRQEFEPFGINSLIALPLVIDNHTIGVLTIYAQETNVFNTEETRLLLELAEDVAYGIATLRTRNEHKKTEKALKETNDLLEKIFSTFHVLVGYMDRDFNFLRVNPAYAQADGKTPEFFVGKNHFDLYPNPENEQIFRKVVKTKKPYHAFEKPFEYSNNRERGITYWDWCLYPVLDEKNNVTGLIFSLQNVTQRKKLEQEILEISQREQQRIGQDLHDVLGQNLTGLSFLAKVLQRKLAEKSLPETAEAEKIAKLCNQAVIQARSLARGLCPVEFKADGLMTALQDFALNLENVFGITCHFVCKTPIFIHDNTVATHLYHIVQEAVNNAIKHGKAKHVKIDLSTRGEKVVLSIMDNGIGIPDDLEKNQGIGLSIMSYRARMIGASFDVQRSGKGGTMVTCEFKNSRPHDKENKP